MLFLLHTFIATLYATILSFRVIFYINGGFSWTLIGAAIFPVLLWMLQLVQISPYVMLTSTMAIFFVFITGIMLVFHSWHLYNGQTYWESEKGLKRDKGLIKNVKDLIGSRWWIVWLFPFVPSPLPGDGTHYPLYNETKVHLPPPSATNKHGGNRRMAKPL
jgi:palmitoyltransferase